MVDNLGYFDDIPKQVNLGFDMKNSQTQYQYRREKGSKYTWKDVYMIWLSKWYVTSTYERSAGWAPGILRLIP